MFVAKDGTAVNGLCFVSHNPLIENCDWLGMVWTHPGEPTRMAGRFRYHREHLGLPDEKRYYGPAERNLSEAIQKLESSASMLSQVWGGTPIYRLRDTNAEGMLRWFHELNRAGHISLKSVPQGL